MNSLALAAAEKLIDKAFDGALSDYLRRRRALAREIIVRRIAKGSLHAALDDDTFSAMLVYIRAAEEGAARQNLEAIADYLARSMAEPEFAPNEFKRHARHLADLSYDECMALALFIESCRKSAPGHEWEFALKKAAKRGSYFESSRDFSMVISSLVRTGWVSPVSAYGGTNYVPTKALRGMARLLDLDAAIRRAKDDQ